MKSYFSHIFILLAVLVLVSGCTQAQPPKAAIGENKVASIEVLDKSFVKDTTGLPIATKIVGKAGLQGKAGAELEFSCRPIYSGQLVEKGISSKEKLNDNGEKNVPITIISTLNNRLDIGKWNVCCDLGNELTQIKTTTVCGK